MLDVIEQLDGFGNVHHFLAFDHSCEQQAHDHQHDGQLNQRETGLLAQCLFFNIFKHKTLFYFE